MASQESDIHISSAWLTFLGLILLLIGIYAGAKTITNIYAFDKYPQGGVLSSNLPFLTNYNTYQREEDCTAPRYYYEKDNATVRQPNEAEKKIESQDTERCIAGVRELRQQAKTNDISQSILFLVLGAGILTTRRMFLRK